MVRYVRMHFRPEEIANFLLVFAQYQDRIRAVSGCQYLALQHDLTDEGCWMTHSRWASEEDLEAYRRSDLFREVWGKTKVLFSKSPEAYSVKNHIELP